MRANAEITVIRITESTTPEQWHIKNVYWQQVEAFSVADQAAVSNSEVSVYIPKKSLGEMPMIKKGDYVARGYQIYDDLSGKALRRKLDQDGARIIQTVNDFLDVGRIRPHIELRCI